MNNNSILLFLVSVDTIGYMLDHGASLEAVDDEGHTPLYIAVLAVNITLRFFFYFFCRINFSKSCISNLSTKVVSCHRSSVVRALSRVLKAANSIPAGVDSHFLVGWLRLQLPYKQKF
jgi:hypothetical protein